MKSIKNRNESVKMNILTNTCQSNFLNACPDHKAVDWNSSESILCQLMIFTITAKSSKNNVISNFINFSCYSVLFLKFKNVPIIVNLLAFFQ